MVCLTSSCAKDKLISKGFRTKSMGRSRNRSTKNQTTLRKSSNIEINELSLCSMFYDFEKSFRFAFSFLSSLPLFPSLHAHMFSLSLSSLSLFSHLSLTLFLLSSYSLFLSKPLSTLSLSLSLSPLLSLSLISLPPSPSPSPSPSLSLFNFSYSLSVARDMRNPQSRGTCVMTRN